MKIKQGAAVVALVAGLGLGGCAGLQPQEVGPSDRPAAVAQPAQGAPASPSPSAAPTYGVDPASAGCATLRQLGVSGTPEQYRAVGEQLSHSRDARLAEAAIALRDASAHSTTNVERAAMISAVLDLAEQCLRVTD